MRHLGRHRNRITARDAQLDGLLAYWDAANDLTVAQIYLRENPAGSAVPRQRCGARALPAWRLGVGLGRVDTLEVYRSVYTRCCKTL